MGTTGRSGPLPKREDERVRRNKAEIDTDTVTVIGTVEVPELGLPDPHPLVVDMYESLQESGQARFYEPSDWQYARLAMLELDGYLKSPRKSSVMLQTLNTFMSNLLMTEGDRRRVRMEVARNEAAETGSNVADYSDWFKQRMGAVQ